MSRAIYISMTGMTEALGESQVVQYILELAKNNTIFLLSYEKPTDPQKYIRMKKKLNDAGIQWKYFKYSNRFGILSTSWQISCGFFTLVKWIKVEKIQLVHTRSLVPAVIGMLLKLFFKTKLLFDIRGFAIDEKIMDGRLKEKSWLTSFLKKLEIKVFRKADHIVTLTHVSKPIIAKKYVVGEKNITVIPTCANVELFKPVTLTEKLILKEQLGFSQDDVIILHNGSLNGWVDFDAELKLFKQLSLLKRNIKFLFLNKGQHDLIRSFINKYELESSLCKIVGVDFDQVIKYLNISDLCVFFIKPSFAKQASAPTKFAELVASHLYSVTNTNYGDMTYYLNSYNVGLLVDLAELHADPKYAAEKVISFLESSPKNDNSDFSSLFSKHFSKQVAVERYQEIYCQLS